MTLPDGILSKITDEQKKKVESAQSMPELLATAKEIGLELTEDVLQGFSGGAEECPNVNAVCRGYEPKCPNVNADCRGYEPKCPNVNAIACGTEAI